MLFNKRINIANRATKVITLTGGLNEQVANSELKPGELVDCLNYLELDDKYHGYTSLKGYERFDGQTAPSAGGTREDITVVPGTGNVTGVHIYSNKVYAFRDNAGDTAGAMYVSSGAGWVEVDTSATPLTKNSTNTRSINARFALYNTNAETMFFVDGVSQPHALIGSTVTEIDMTSVVGADIFPTHLGAWQNRLFLVYPNGHILFSEVGDPTAWDSTTGLAGEIFIGADITNVAEAPGGVLVFFTRETTKILNYGSTSNEFIFKLDEFSSNSGALEDTVKNMLGTLYFSDDRGFSSMAATAEFGDFSASNIGKNVQKTFNTYRDYMSYAMIDRNTNRFYQLYDGVGGSPSGGLAFTFRGNRLKGATKIRLNHVVTSATEGAISNVNKMFFGASNGMVYEFLSGTSFDGEVIPTRLTTSYYHYGSNRNWKNFKRIGFEISSDSSIDFGVTPIFNYSNKSLPSESSSDMNNLDGTTGIWGTGVWGTFTYGGAVLGTPTLYIQGYGVNMAVKVATSTATAKPHTIHNISTDFTINNMQQ